MIEGYDATFYDRIRPGCISSAEVIVPMFLARYGPRLNPEPPGTISVIDVGCGEGFWSHEFAQAGCDVFGIDGEHVQATTLGDRLVHADLELPLPNVGHFDVAICLEVAEHLPDWRAESFVLELCGLADVVVFSAAIPHQTGAGHITLRWQSWWAAMFAEHGKPADGSMRWDLWNDHRVEPWYRQNLVVYGADSDGGPLDVVHPIIHEWGR